MPATVQQVADGIADALNGAIQGMHAYGDQPDNITPPCAVAILDSVSTFHGAQQGGLPTYQMRVQVIVDNLDSRAAFRKLNDLASYDGSGSLRAAIEADTTLGGVCQTLIVERVENIGQVEVGQVRYLAADVIVTVYA